MQQVIVLIIFILCMLATVRYLGKFFTNNTDRKKSCASCTSDCKLKSSLRKHKGKCSSDKTDAGKDKSGKNVDTN